MDIDAPSIPSIPNSSGETSISQASTDDIEEWTSRLSIRGGGDGVSISGPSVDLVADALLSLLNAERSSVPAACPPGVIVTHFSKVAMAQYAQMIKMYASRIFGASQLMSIFSRTTRGISTGIGPLRATLRAGIHKTIKSNAIFGLRGDFYHPKFFPVASAHRENAFWVAGFWSAIHLIKLSLMPDPISPWLLYAAACGKDGFPTELEYIRALDPRSAAVLEPWYTFHASDILHGDMTGSIQQLLIVYLDLHDVRCSRSV
jgi:hypothetical protein